jgi:predicted transcriptional regulator
MTEQPGQSRSEANEGDALDEVLFLARAESRVNTVNSLLESGAASRRKLQARLDVSRTTLSRALQSLTDRGWVEKTGSACRLTRIGQLVVTEFTDMLRRWRESKPARSSSAGSQSTSKPPTC